MQSIFEIEFVMANCQTIRMQTKVSSKSKKKTWQLLKGLLELVTKV